MNKIFLITRPKYDATTHYLFNWAQEIVDLATKKLFNVLDVQKDRVNKKELASIISKKQPSFIFFNGHGGDDCVCGHDNEVLFKITENENLLRSEIVYALSCKSGKKLGPECVKDSVKSYIGYDEDFIFFVDDDKMTKPLEDDTAKKFLYPANYVARCILKGHTVEDSCRRSRNLFRENMQKLLSAGSSSELVPYLLWDMKHQICLGDKNLCLS